MKKIMVLWTLFLALFLGACQAENPPVDPVINTFQGLSSVESVDAIKTLVEPHLSEYQTTDGWFFRTSGFFTMMAETTENFMSSPEVDASNDAPEESQTSQTNVQIEGVDEGDIIKTDGDRIYRVEGNTLTVIELLENGAMEIVLNLSMDSENPDESFTYYRELYLTDDYIVATGQRQMVYSLISDSMYRSLPFFEMGTPFSTITIIDKGTLEIVDVFDITGSINTSRLIDDQLYVMSYHFVYSLEEDFNPLPVFKENGEEIRPDARDVSFIPGTPLENFTIITQIDLSGEPSMDNEILLGAMSWGQVYVNLDGIYFASSRYEDMDGNGIYQVYGELISYTFNEDGSLSFGGVGTYQGNIQNQFWMDGDGDFFRLVTTEGWGENAINRLYILERKTGENGPYFDQAALIDEGLGKPGETIRSARFNGDLATVVTFEQTDPLYTIDLSDPYNPIIRAGLEITGFSTYQHPWKNDTLIGVGYEADENGRTTGIKLTLFDISDWDNPVEIGEPLVLLNNESTWQYSEALHNHKAILIGESYDFIGFALGRSGYSDTGYYYSQDYLIFDIDETRAMPIQIDQNFSHQDLLDLIDDPALEDSTREEDDYMYERMSAMIERAVYTNDTLYLISNLGVTSHDLLNDYADLDTLIYE